MAARSIALAFSLPLLAAAAPPNAERLARLGPRMQAFVDAGKVAGAVTLIQHRGQRVHQEAHGYLNLTDKSPMKADSIFEVMSMTKPVTATAIMMLAEEGKLALTDAVEKHLPEFRGAQWVNEADGRQVKAARAITLRDLLTHASGLPELPPAGMGGGQFYLRMDKSLADAVTLYSQLPLLFQPGTRVQYSNPGNRHAGTHRRSTQRPTLRAFSRRAYLRPPRHERQFLLSVRSAPGAYRAAVHHPAGWRKTHRPRL